MIDDPQFAVIVSNHIVSAESSAVEIQASAFT
jgi:hypothetical protein